jgi:hypothetical protein
MIAMTTSSSIKVNADLTDGRAGFDFIVVIKMRKLILQPSD